MHFTRSGFFRRLRHGKADPREAVRPLWHRVVAISREPEWYAACGVADTVAGRFDMITAVMALVVLRMEDVPDLRGPSAHLIELFVEDMDGQLREFGINDVVVGKHMGRLMSTLGGRMGAYREALRGSDATAFRQAVARNVTFADEGLSAMLGDRLRALATRLADTSDADVLAGRIG
ncbi:hypothetical protein EYB45_09150 [Erythrobacteraceae bacterium CFH 75059]|uniref:ubiquinol-cytochrome C chaperone family protein n=1 Tax=Qipengyuania thermophila TaxID=2509361 RepID=UPI00101EEED2|nr:ubiquinol-cytochrome C chaperone family protein [Qipengyuania thermophila]TCD04085.1 hypothetical protein EYB45_09150 [Erythrobacteraceae bacterium CFH 75059]